MIEPTRNRAERGHGPRQVLLLGGSSARRSTVALAVRLCGQVVVEATTSLEAIVRLQDDDAPIGMAVVAGNTSSATGEELTAFLVDAFPSVHVVAAHRSCCSVGMSTRGVRCYRSSGDEKKPGSDWHRRPGTRGGTVKQEQIRAEIMAIVKHAEHHRVRPFRITRDLSRMLQLPTTAIKRALGELIDRRELVYTYRDPCSFVEAVDGATN